MKGIINPKQICFCCKEKIFNRGKNALYCKKHSEVVNRIRQRTENKLYSIKVKFKEYKISYRLNLTVVTQKNEANANRGKNEPIPNNKI